LEHCMAADVDDAKVVILEIMDSVCQELELHGPTTQPKHPEPVTQEQIKNAQCLVNISAKLLDKLNELKN